MGKSARPTGQSKAYPCTTCGQRKFPLSSTNECSTCNPERFYKDYPAVGRKQ